MERKGVIVMQEIKIELTKTPKQKPADQSKLGFGTIFTDHMYVMPYNREQGWHDPKLAPLAPSPFPMPARVDPFPAILNSPLVCSLGSFIML